MVEIPKSTKISVDSPAILTKEVDDIKVSLSSLTRDVQDMLELSPRFFNSVRTIALTWERCVWMLMNIRRKVCVLSTNSPIKLTS